MYKRDLIVDEAERFAKVIAKLLGLKTDADNEQYIQAFNQTLKDHHNAALNELLQYSTEELSLKIEKERYSADKLDALAQLLYLYAEPFNKNEETLLSLKKILLIYDLLEEQYHRQSFENVNKRNQILQFIKNTYGVEKT